jgi:polo-like kinase 4
MAPEVIARESYGLNADIWSIGVIFFWMVYGKPPYNSSTYRNMIEEIKNKQILKT